MTNYMCSIELDVEADDPGEAARKMWAAVYGWVDYLPVIEVFDIDKGTKFTVDLELVDDDIDPDDPEGPLLDENGAKQT